MYKFVNLFFFIVFYLNFSTSIAEIFYVDSDLGNDLNKGNTIETPWKTINRVNRQVYQNDDKILFRRDREWQNVVLKIETPRLTIGAYGEGKRPRLIGSIEKSEWKEVKNIPGVYVMNVPRPIDQKIWGNWEVQLVMEDDFFFYHREDNKINPRKLKVGSFVYSIKKQRLYIKPLDGIVEGKRFYIGQQENIIEIQHSKIDNLVIQDLEISLANRYGVGPWWQGDKLSQGNILIKNNLFIGNAFSAICLSGNMPYNDILIENNEIIENGAEGIYIGKYIAKRSLKIINNVIGSEVQDSFGWRGEGIKSAFNGDGIDIKVGNHQVLVEKNIIRNLSMGIGISYHSGESIIANNVVENVGMPGTNWPSGIMVDIDDDYGTSVIRNNRINVNDSYGINVRGKAAIGPSLVIENNRIELREGNSFAQVGFTAMNSANVKIKNNNGTGGLYAIKIKGMPPKNILITDNDWGQVKNVFFLPNSKLSGLTVFNNYFCKGVFSFIEWGNLVRENDFEASKKLLGSNNSIIQRDCK